MMRKIFLAALAALTLSACTDTSLAERAVTLRQTYASLASYEAEAAVEILRGEELLVYTLALAGEGEQTQVEILAPEELRGAGARISGETLQVTYDGLVLDALTANETLSAANAVPFALQTLAHGYLLEQGTEKVGENELLRLGLEGELGASVLTVALYFADDGRPIFAEIAEKGEILARIEFTKFAFGAIMPLE